MAINWTSGLLQGYNLYDQLDRLSNISDQAVEGTNQLGDQAIAGTQFKPYTVKTGSGTTAVDAAGGYESTLSPQLQALQSQMYGGASDAFGQNGGDPYLTGLLSDFRASQTDPRAYQLTADNKKAAYDASGQFMQNSMVPTAGREAEIYDRIRAMQEPGEGRARLEMDDRLLSQGRAGIRSDAYGGTPEQFAMEKAIAEARNTASMQALGQAQSEMMNQGNLANMYGQMGHAGAGLQQSLASQNVNDILGLSQGDLNNRLGVSDIGMGLFNTAMLPEAQNLNALQASQNLANMANTGQIAGTNLASQLGLGGLQTSLNADVARSNLIGNAMGSFAEHLGDTDFDPIGGFFKEILGL